MDRFNAQPDDNQQNNNGDNSWINNQDPSIDKTEENDKVQQEEPNDSATSETADNKNPFEANDTTELPQVEPEKARKHTVRNILVGGVAVVALTMGLYSVGNNNDVHATPDTPATSESPIDPDAYNIGSDTEDYDEETKSESPIDPDSYDVGLDIENYGEDDGDPLSATELASECGLNDLSETELNVGGVADYIADWAEEVGYVSPYSSDITYNGSRTPSVSMTLEHDDNNDGEHDYSAGVAVVIDQTSEDFIVGVHAASDGTEDKTFHSSEIPTPNELYEMLH